MFMTEMRWLLGIGLLLAHFQVLASSCRMLSDQSVMLADKDRTYFCRFIQPYVDQDRYRSQWHYDDDDAKESGYWDNWGLQSQDNPVFTEHLDTSYFGLGVWMPNDVDRDSMSTEEWLLNHRLQLSVGLGDGSTEPRLRLDYRWRTETQGDIMLQLELPF